MIADLVPEKIKLHISDEIRENYFKSPYKLDSAVFADFKNPLVELIEKEKEKMERDIAINNTTATFGGIPCKVERVDIHREFSDGCTYLRIHAVIPNSFEAKFKVNGTNEQHTPKIKDVIFNPPATIVFWVDGTKSVVKCEDEEYDPEKGLAMAIARKALGNKYDYYNVIKKWLKKAPKLHVFFKKKFNIADVDISNLGDLIDTTNNGFKVYLDKPESENKEEKK